MFLQEPCTARHHRLGIGCVGTGMFLGPGVWQLICPCSYGMLEAETQLYTNSVGNEVGKTSTCSLSGHLGPPAAPAAGCSVGPRLWLLQPPGGLAHAPVEKLSKLDKQHMQRLAFNGMPLL